MTVFRNYVKRILARPLVIGFTVAVPALIVLLSGVEGTGGTIRVALFDHDDSTLSRMVSDAIAPVATPVAIDEDEIGDALLDGRIEYALILPHGLEESVLQGQRASVRSHSLQGVEATGSVRYAADSVLSAAHNVARAVGGDRAAFVRAMELSENGLFTVQTESYQSDRSRLPGATASSVAQLVGMLTLTMLALTLTACFIFLRDVETGTFHRTLAGPVSLRRYMLETNASFFLTTVLQGIVMAIAIGLLYPRLETPATLMLALVFAVFSLVAVSFALSVATIAKTVRRTQVTANATIILMAMLGGAFWPVDIMPSFFQRVSDFTPIKWVTDTTRAILTGAEFAEIVPNVGILLLFAVVFQFLGSWRRVDIAK